MPNPWGEHGRLLKSLRGSAALNHESSVRRRPWFLWRRQTRRFKEFAGRQRVLFRKVEAARAAGQGGGHKTPCVNLKATGSYGNLPVTAGTSAHRTYTSGDLCEALCGLAEADATTHHPDCGWCPLDEATNTVGLGGEVGMKPAWDAPAIAGVPSLTEPISDYRFLMSNI
jgi:hypothetical protein